ncbi:MULTISPECIES: hypothetical protein, partial [unclassified Leifsonia]|uniref:hypothetical protein n=1 Tax=unclassified Leifsonia TaxID=2663824 RepID=UPI0008A7C7C9
MLSSSMFLLGRRLRTAVAVMAAALVAGSVLVATPAQAAAPAGLVVLDPDDNYSHAVWGGQ